MSVRLYVCVLLGLILTIAPLPAIFVEFRPLWILLLVIYWQCFLPNYFRIKVLLILGLFLDVLQVSVLGEHVFVLSFVALIVSRISRRFGFFSMGMQMFLVGLFCFIYQSLILMVEVLLGYPISFRILLPAILMSLLLWPWIKLLADTGLLEFKQKYIHPLDTRVLRWRVKLLNK